jgi:nucleoside-diphosphate-sugar epimerase
MSASTRSAACACSNGARAPGTVYAVAKVACEQWLGILERGYGLPWTTLRLFATYGAGHKPNTYQGILNIMLTQLVAGPRVVVRGSLDRTRDLLYVDDAARAIVAAIERPDARGAVINVGTGIAVSIRELIYAIADVIGRARDTIEIVEEPGTVGDPLTNVAAVERASSLLGFTAEFDLRRGLEAFVQTRLAPR